MPTRVLDREGLDALIARLVNDGFQVLGPTIEDGAIIYDEIESTEDLPVGWTDEQKGGAYRLARRDDEALFGYNVGPTGWKRFLYPPQENLFNVQNDTGRTRFLKADIRPRKRALFGVRPCELAAIAIQDRVFLDSGHVDAGYAARRAEILLIAVECGTAGGSCFCTSMGTGPSCSDGYDLRITEITDDGSLSYVLDAATEVGEEIVSGLDSQAVSDEDLRFREMALANAEAEMGLSMDTDGLRDLLVHGFDNPRWEDVAERCLTCGNCTMACPTCFCSTVTDSVSLDGVATRTRAWDSCFSLEFSGLHGHPVRSSTKSRYRQWMTHKLGTWHDQFGMSGCVGCGRCITWCPVGIDITAEVRAMREEVHV